MPAPSAPLAAGYREAPLWHDGVELPAVVRDARPLPASADVVIVGGGYCGVMAAAELARRGRHTVVVEADPIGVGASTRNGGMVIPELKYGPKKLAKRYGALGGELIDAVFDAFDLVERTIDEHAIECDYARTGGLLLAHHDGQLAALRDMEREWVDDLGESARFVPRAELGAEVGTRAYAGGVVLEKTGGLHPARYHAGLVRVALDAGAEMHGATRALALDRRGPGRWRVETNRGNVDAGDVLVATNAYRDGLVPWLERRVLPFGSFVIATEVLDPDVARAVSPRGRMFFDTKNFLFYWRLSPDGRVVFGGRTSLGATTVPIARDVLYREMVRVHPQLTGARVERAWGGSVAVTLDRLPHCGRVDGAAFATGCNGTGIALATWFGMRAAAWMSGEEPAPAFAQLPFPAIPLHGFHEQYLPAVGWWLRARDRVGR